MAKQRKMKFKGQPAARWPLFMQIAVQRIAAHGGFRPKVDPVKQIAAAIVAANEGPAFLCSVRRGRPTQVQNLRYQLLREVEALIGPSVPRRREDRNTPERGAGVQVLELEGPQVCSTCGRSVDLRPHLGGCSCGGDR